MIRYVNVTQHYGIRPVLRDVNVEIPRGQVVAVVGPNGMGKSTLLKVAAGILAPQRGHVEINGLRRRASPETELAIRRQTVFLPDHPWLPKNRTGREFLMAVGQLYDVPVERLMDHVERLLKLFDLAHEGDWPISSYSNGQQKKIAIAAVLVTDAPVMILDELFGGGLDPAGILSLKRVLAHLAARDDVTILMSAPVPELLEEFAERVLVLRDGMVAAHDTPENLRRQTGAATLAEALGTLVFPTALANIDDYLKGQRP